jgi:hypothetical protein
MADEDAKLLADSIRYVNDEYNAILKLYKERFKKRGEYNVYKQAFAYVLDNVEILKFTKHMKRFRQLEEPNVAKALAHVACLANNSPVLAWLDKKFGLAKLNYKGLWQKNLPRVALDSGLSTAGLSTIGCLVRAGISIKALGITPKCDDCAGCYISFCCPNCAKLVRIGRSLQNLERLMFYLMYGANLSTSKNPPLCEHFALAISGAHVVQLLLAKRKLSSDSGMLLLDMLWQLPSIDVDPCLHSQ